MSTRIIFNDRVLFRPLTGVGHYARQLLIALAPEGDGGVEMRPFLSRIMRRSVGGEPAKAQSPHSPAGGAPAAAKTGGGRWKSVLRRVAAGPYEWAFRFAAGRCGLYHEPNHVPIPCGVPTVTTIHDLSVVTHPEWHPADRVRWYERRFDAGVRQTTRFIAASEFTKQDMVSRLGVSPDVIDVTYQAPRPGFGPQDPTICRQIRDSFNLPERFFLFVGTLEPRKNVAGLLESFAALPASLREQCPLVMVGGQGWKMERLTEMIASRGITSQTQLLGYQPDEVLASLYASCTALVWPTLFEGFGLPPLEAMSCGGAVVVSGVASLPEVVGDAGVLLDPHDTPAWTEAMRRMVEDDAWREDWRRRGVARAGTFSWRRCAQETVACYLAALKSA